MKDALRMWFLYSVMIKQQWGRKCSYRDKHIENKSEQSKRQATMAGRVKSIKAKEGRLRKSTVWTQVCRKWKVTTQHTRILTHYPITKIMTDSGVLRVANPLAGLNHVVEFCWNICCHVSSLFSKKSDRITFPTLILPRALNTPAVSPLNVWIEQFVGEVKQQTWCRLLES